MLCEALIQFKDACFTLIWLPYALRESHVQAFDQAFSVADNAIHACGTVLSEKLRDLTFDTIRDYENLPTRISSNIASDKGAWDSELDLIFTVFTFSVLDIWTEILAGIREN